MLQHFDLLTKVRKSANDERLLPHSYVGAKHLYLLDYDPANLPNLKEAIEQRYPDVKVIHRREVIVGF